MILKLNNFQIGQEGKVVKVNGEGRVRRRLFDMERRWRFIG